MKQRSKGFIILAVLAATSLAANAVPTTTNSWGGAATTDVDNWVTSSTPFDDTVQSGHSLNWENVLVNTATINSASNYFDVSFQTDVNYTIGHLYMYNQSFDLSGTALGIETLTMTADFDASSMANWSPVVAIDSGGSTTYYRWNHSGNQWNGNGALDFSIGGNFDLSQLGNAPNTATAIWGELVDTATSFAGTRINGNNPNLQATTGLFSVGFIQWGASTGGSIATQLDFTTAIDSFEVGIGYSVPEPSTFALLGLGGLALALRRRR